MINSSKYILAVADVTLHSTDAKDCKAAFFMLFLFVLLGWGFGSVWRLLVKLTCCILNNCGMCRPSHKYYGTIRGEMLSYETFH